MSDYHNPYMNNVETYSAYKEGYQQGREDAIEEYRQKLHEHCEECYDVNWQFHLIIEEGLIDKIAEQIKEQKNERI